MTLYQATLASSVKFNGVGLHSGKLVNIIIHPAPPGSGITFKRVDLKPHKEIKASPYNVISTTLCTTIGQDGVKVATIEHLMASFSGLGIDNASIHVDSDEIPILDGSSARFVDRIQDVGIQLQPFRKKMIKLSHSLRVEEGDSYIHFHPSASDCLLINCRIHFPRSKAIDHQSYSLKLTESNFVKICEARTFCHIDDVNYMRSNGLALGGSLDNAVVVDKERVLNNDGLRFANEFVRHKLLDCIGDLALLGGRLLGTLEVYKGGHSLHISFVKKLYEHLAALGEEGFEQESEKLQPLLNENVFISKKSRNCS